MKQQDHRVEMQKNGQGMSAAWMLLKPGGPPVFKDSIHWAIYL